jgi:16S rRNA (uracil1498-N3)-methyltransferase
MPRLFCSNLLKNDVIVDLQEGAAHYLKNVLRLTRGSHIDLFNEQDGEWRAEVLEILKNKVVVRVTHQQRQSEPVKKLCLCFSPIKHDPLDFMVEKATELGVTDFYPVITERCNISRVNVDRLQKNVIEASQQCERLDCPVIHPLQKLESFLERGGDFLLFVCRERGKAEDITRVFLNMKGNLLDKVPVFLIGPEGGFSESEWRYLERYKNVHMISLGRRILRAETAAIAALSVYQSLLGDWQEDRNQVST